MSVNISYMGTKRDLAIAVGDVIQQGQNGVMLDAFAGMCSVGERVAPARQVWCNDIQVFASEIARALFTSRDEPLDAIRAAELHFGEFENHRLLLTEMYRGALEAEDCLLKSPNFKAFSRRKNQLSKKLAAEIATSKRHRGNLFTTTYSDNYFGVRQAIEVDATVRAIRTAYRKDSITLDHRRWLTIALGRAMLKIANSTGHFAQFLQPRESSYKRYITLRRRSLWSEWLFSEGELCSVGTSDWRRLNKCFNEDSLLLLPRLTNAKERPAVVYADPPYTDDQYSRYYHVLETLVLYDYPTTSGAGLYRPNRFCSPFSVKSRAVQAFDSLVHACAQTGADMVLSYPTNGLVYDAGADPRQLLRKYYRRVECCYSLPHTHSTFGASKGTVRSKVTERIYLAKS